MIDRPTSTPRVADAGSSKADRAFQVQGLARQGAELRPIGPRSDRDVEVLSGLAEGDEVVVVGHDRLRDGQPVKTYRRD